MAADILRGGLIRAGIVTSGRFPPIVIVGLSVVWMLHVVHTELGDPLGGIVDTGLWAVGSLLKCGSLIALPILLARVYVNIAGSVRRSGIAFIVWWIILASLTLLLAATRDLWANAISNDAVTYYARHQAEALPSSIEQHRAAWAESWASGTVVGAELAVITVLAALHAFVGLRLGHRPLAAVFSGYGASALVLFAYLSLTPWTLWTYDTFHGDILAGALLLDSLLFFVANDPYTTIASLFHLALLGSAMVIRRLTGGAGGENTAAQTDATGGHGGRG